MMNNWIDPREIRNANAEGQVDEKYENDNCKFASL